MKKYVYFIKGDRVISSQFGDTEKNDESGVVALADKWLSEDPSNSVIYADNAFSQKNKDLILDSRSLREMTTEEKLARDQSDKDSKDQNKNDRKNIKKSLALKLKIDESDIPALKAIIEDGDLQ